MKKFFILFFILIPFQLFAQSPFKVLPYGSLDLKAGGGFEFEIVISMPPGHYLYADEFTVDLNEQGKVILTGFDKPACREQFDQFYDKVVGICDGIVVLNFRGAVMPDAEVGAGDLKVSFGFRGCSPKQCLMPETREISVPYSISGAQGESRTSKKDYYLIPLAFLAGILSAFTPCLWPVIPILLLFIGVRPGGEKSRNIEHSLLFICGLSMTYASLGLLTSMLGKSFGFLFQEKWFLAFIVLFFLIMSLSLFGFFEIKIPTGIQKKLEQIKGRGLKRAFLGGVTTGLIASPCITPVIAGILALVAVKGGYLWGTSLLFFYALGLGVVFLIVGSFAWRLSKKIKAGRWLVVVQRVFALLMLVPALYYGSLLVRGETIYDSSKSRIEWQSNEAAFSIAKAKRMPIMIKFEAKWCMPCWKMNWVMNDDDIVELSKNFVNVKVDATNETPFALDMAQRFNIRGVPTLLFISPDGDLYDDLTVYEPDHDLVRQSMSSALQR